MTAGALRPLICYVYMRCWGSLRRPVTAEPGSHAAEQQDAADKQCSAQLGQHGKKEEPVKSAAVQLPTKADHGVGAADKASPTRSKTPEMALRGGPAATGQVAPPADKEEQALSAAGIHTTAVQAALAADSACLVDKQTPQMALPGTPVSADRRARATQGSPAVNTAHPAAILPPHAAEVTLGGADGVPLTADLVPHSAIAASSLDLIPCTTDLATQLALEASPSEHQAPTSAVSNTSPVSSVDVASASLQLPWRVPGTQQQQQQMVWKDQSQVSLLLVLCLTVMLCQC